MMVGRGTRVHSEAMFGGIERMLEGVETPPRDRRLCEGGPYLTETVTMAG